MQNDDTLCKSLIKLRNERKLSSIGRYVINDDKLLHKVVKEDNKSFHLLVVTQALIKYILH